MALRGHAGMGITASLACSHVKGKGATHHPLTHGLDAMVSGRTPLGAVGWSEATH